MEVLENRPLHSSTLRYSLEVDCNNIIIIVKMMKDTVKHVKFIVSGFTSSVSCQQGIFGTGKANLNQGLFTYNINQKSVLSDPCQQF